MKASRRAYGQREKAGEGVDGGSALCPPPEVPQGVREALGVLQGHSRGLRRTHATRQPFYGENYLPTEKDWSAGLCTVFACALHERFGLPMRALVEEAASDGHQTVVHAFCLLGDQAVDARGIRARIPEAGDFVPGGGSFYYEGEASTFKVIPVDRDLLQELHHVENMNDTASARWFIEHSGRFTALLEALPPRQVDLWSLPVVRKDQWPDGTVRTFVATPFKALDRRVDLPLGKEAAACVQTSLRLEDLYASQAVVTIEGMAKPRDDSYGLPLVVRSNGILYIQDGHHRLAKEFFDGAQTARVRFLDLDLLRRA